MALCPMCSMFHHGPLSLKEYNQEYPDGSSKRQDFERIHGPWKCGHVRCEDLPSGKCLEQGYMI